MKRKKKSLNQLGKDEKKKQAKSERFIKKYITKDIARQLDSKFEYCEKAGMTTTNQLCFWRKFGRGDKPCTRCNLLYCMYNDVVEMIKEENNNGRSKSAVSNESRHMVTVPVKVPFHLSLRLSGVKIRPSKVGDSGARRGRRIRQKANKRQSNKQGIVRCWSGLI